MLCEKQKEGLQPFRVLFSAILFSLICFGIGMIFYAILLGRNRDSNSLSLVFGIAIPYVVAIWYLCKHWRLIRLPFTLKSSAIWFGLLLSALVLLLPLKASEEEIKQLRDFPNVDLWLYLIIACTLIPLLEEILFRGLIFARFIEVVGVGKSVVLSLGLFVGLHALINHESLLVSLIIGSIFTYVYYKTKSYYASSLVHIAYNTFWFVLALYNIR